MHHLALCRVRLGLFYGTPCPRRGWEPRGLTYRGDIAPLPTRRALAAEKKGKRKPRLAGLANHQSNA